MKNVGRSNLSKLFTNTSDRTILVLFFGIISLQAIPSLLQESPTFDEVMRQLPGYLSLSRGNYALHMDHPPLVKLITSLPLFLTEINLPPTPKEWTDLARWRFAHDFLFNGNNADRLVLLGRLSLFPLFLLLGFFVYTWSKKTFGQGAAVVALTFYSFEPNILAHGRLMNTDFAVTCFSFLTIYGVHQLLYEISLPRLFLTGLALGLAVTTKFSALWVIPTLLLLGAGALHRKHAIALKLPNSEVFTSSGTARKLLLVLGSFLFIGLIAYTMIWGAYLFRYGAAPAGDQLFQVSWEESLPERPVAQRAVLWARENRVLPEAYLLGLSRTLKGLKRYAFLMGDISNEGWWYYFLVTFAIKTPLALLLAICLTPLSLRSLWRKRPLTALCLAAPVVTYFFIASASKLNIGHRHLLPIYPFLFVLAGSAASTSGIAHNLRKAGLTVVLLWYVMSSASIFPHYLAYFNELVGGPNNGYKYLVDSNLDWGQDLKGLKRYMDEHKITRVWLSYFGTASPEYYGIDYNALPSYIIFEPRRERIPTPYVAISATNLQGIYLEATGYHADLFKAFRSKKPLAKVGFSIFIYKLSDEEMAAWR